jgi:hypothetical protein
MYEKLHRCTYVHPLHEKHLFKIFRGPEIRFFSQHSKTGSIGPRCCVFLEAEYSAVVGVLATTIWLLQFLD